LSCDRKSSHKNNNLGSMSTSEDVHDAPTPHSNSLSKSLPNSLGPLNEDQLQPSPDTATIELPVPDCNDLLQDLPIESPLDSPIHFDTFLPTIILIATAGFTDRVSLTIFPNQIKLMHNFSRNQAYGTFWTAHTLEPHHVL
jgi:hypothetical protein